jgi:hypothetical protein
MRRLLKPLLPLFLLLTLPAFSHAADKDTPETRRAAAERYLGVSNVEKMLGDMSTAMTQNMPPDKAADVRNLLTKHVRIDALKQAMLISMVKFFTTRELDAMAKFYGSAEGKSSLEKFGPYMADVMPMIQAEMQHAMEAAQAEKAAAKPPT